MSLKKAIQEVMLIPYRRNYRRNCQQAEHAYDEYIRNYEQKVKEKKAGSKMSVEVRSYSKGFDLSDTKAEIVIFVSDDAILSSFARREICNQMAENENICLLYGDEDYCEGTIGDYSRGVPASKRKFPFMKPIPSWEPFLSYFYIGAMFAVRTKDVREIAFPRYETPLQDAYSFLLRVWHQVGEERILHCSSILAHRPVVNMEDCEGFLEGADASFNKIKEDFFQEIGLNAELKEDECGICHVVYKVAGNPLVSVIIPSKDNPEVLKTCIDSLLNVNTYRNIEFVVIDNGSSKENKNKIEEYAKSVEGMRYIYAPQEFNYSHLNNQASKEARGEILLLLNDDMEVKSPFAIERMVGQVQNPQIGAVGAKLLYPDSTLIQHVGITNAVDGPVHKFIGKDDRQVYHHGRNRLVYNCLAVTGACLMVRKEDFDRLGGLNEELKVAYNDVDFCFRLMEAGFRNVVRNDCVFYHHESLSRGTDALSEEKMKRLIKERNLLYSLHMDFYQNDPYEGAMISGGSELNFDLENQFNREKKKSEKPKITKRNYHKYPAGVYVVFERLEKEEFARSMGEVYHVLQGYALVQFNDNMRFTYEMVFEGSKGVNYKMPMRGFLRMNLEAGFPGTENTRLAGFCNFVTESELPPDTYTVCIFAIDHAARRRLYQNTGRTITIGEQS